MDFEPAISQREVASSRDLGVWDEVAALDSFALEKAVAEGKWFEKRYTVTLKEERGDE